MGSGRLASIQRNENVTLPGIGAMSAAAYCPAPDARTSVRVELVNSASFRPITPVKNFAGSLRKHNMRVGQM